MRRSCIPPMRTARLKAEAINLDVVGHKMCGKKPLSSNSSEVKHQHCGEGRPSPLCKNPFSHFPLWEIPLPSLLVFPLPDHF